MEKMYYPKLKETVLRQTLPNGLQVVLVPRPGFQKKVAYFATNFGSMDTEFMLDGKKMQVPEGIAHYLEHKLFDMPDRDVTAEFAALGAYPNAFTSYHMTAYHFACTERFFESLKLLLEFVSTPYFTPESVEKEQGIIGQEIGMYRDNPEAKVFENMAGISYAEHPVRQPILGTEETIARITHQMLYDCHRAFYHPENMLLCVIGDVDPEELCRIAMEMLPTQPRPDVQPMRVWQEKMQPVRQKIEEKMDVAMPMFSLGFKCEPVGEGQEMFRREIIGELAAEALLGESSELYLRLYEQGIIDGSFGGGFDTMDGMAQLTAGGDSFWPEKVRDAICQQAAVLAREGIPEEDFQRLKRSAVGRRIRALDRFDSTNFRVCAYAFSDVDYFRFPEAYQQVRREEIQEFFSRVVTPERCALSVILPANEEDNVCSNG